MAPAPADDSTVHHQDFSMIYDFAALSLTVHRLNAAVLLTCAS